MRKFAALLALFVLAACARPQPQALPPAMPAPVRPPPPVEAEPFLGLQAPQLRALLGAPAFMRKDGATEMWRYDTQSCRGFFFLTGSPATVGHVDTLPQGPGDSPDPACLKALRASLPARRS